MKKEKRQWLGREGEKEKDEESVCERQRIMKGEKEDKEREKKNGKREGKHNICRLESRMDGFMDGKSDEIKSKGQRPSSKQSNVRAIIMLRLGLARDF